MRGFLGLPAIVWVALAFAGGVAAADRWSAGVVPTLYVLAAAGTVCAAGAVSRRPAVRAAAAAALVACLGLTYAVWNGGHQPTWPEGADGRMVVAAGVVVSPPEMTLRGWRAVLRLRRVELDPSGPRPRGVLRRSSRDGQPPNSSLPAPSGAGDSVRLTGRGQPPEILPGAHVVVRGRFRAGRPAGNPGERSERDALRRRGLAGVITTAGGGITVERPGAWSVRALLASVRRGIVQGTLNALPEPRGGLLLSLLLGIDTHLPPDLYRLFSQAGLVHLMVVSGAQVAIVAGACASAATAARFPAAARSLVTAAGVAAFALAVEWAPSIGRAVIMTAVGIGATLLGRFRDRAAALALAALVLLVIDPGSLHDIGFQLSFAATWGLLYVAPALQQRLAGLGPKLGPALGVTLGAQVAVAPLLAAHFQTLPVAGIVANILVLPIIAVVVPAGFVLLPVVAWLPIIGGPMLSLLRPVLDLLIWIGTRFGGLPWSSIPTPPVPGWLAAVLLLWTGGAVAVASGSVRLLGPARITAIAAALLVLAGWYRQATAPPTALIVTMLDVGQGDAILIQVPSGRAMLVDGGGEIGASRAGWDIGRQRVVPALRRAGVRRLDVVLLSHPHEDHVGGLPAVVENFPVGLVLDPGVPHPSPSYARLLRLVEAGRVPYQTARAGMIVDLGLGATYTVLYPPEPIPAVDGDPSHAGAVVGRLAFGQSAMLFTGDAEAAAERYLLDRGTPLTAQILKVGHHGSRTSTSPAFVSAVRPQIALISLGADNEFGHPHASTLETLVAAGVSIYRTDLVGAIRVSTDGVTWRVTTTRAARDTAGSAAGEPGSGGQHARLR